MPTRRTWNRTGGTTRTTTRYTGGTTRTYNFTGNTTAYSPTQFKNVNRNITHRITSYRNIQSQFTGNGKVTAFSPNTVNRWINYINNGAFVYKFTSNEFSRFFGPRFNSFTTTSNAFRFLRTKFGAGIKDVTRGKGGSWLVAASPTVSARPFSTYKW